MICMVKMGCILVSTQMYFGVATKGLPYANSCAFQVIHYITDISAMCSVTSQTRVQWQNVNSHASLTISCTVNSGQSQCILIVSGLETFRETK